MLDKIIIGKNLANARSKAGIKSQQDLANILVDFSRSQIGQYESGNNLPPLAFLTSFFKLTNTSFDEIILGLPKSVSVTDLMTEDSPISLFNLLDELSIVTDEEKRMTLISEIKTMAGNQLEELTLQKEKNIQLLEKQASLLDFLKKEFNMKP